MSVGHGADLGFLAVSPQVTLVDPGGRLPLLSTRPAVTFLDKVPSQDSNPRHVNRKSVALPIAPRRHRIFIRSTKHELIGADVFHRTFYNNASLLSIRQCIDL